MCLTRRRLRTRKGNLIDIWAYDTDDLERKFNVFVDPPGPVDKEQANQCVAVYRDIANPLEVVCLIHSLLNDLPAE